MHQHWHWADKIQLSTVLLPLVLPLVCILSCSCSMWSDQHGKPAHDMGSSSSDQHGKPAHEGEVPFKRGTGSPPHEGSFHFVSWLQENKPKLQKATMMSTIVYELKAPMSFFHESMFAPIYRNFYLCVGIFLFKHFDVEPPVKVCANESVPCTAAKTVALGN